MGRITLRWSQIVPKSSNQPSLVAKLRRSSHGLAIIDDTAYIFGGEKEPRKPIDSDLYSINLKTGETSSSKLNIASRVGNTLTASDGSLYLFGGRGGTDMTPLSPELQRIAVSGPVVDLQARVVSQVIPGMSYHTAVAVDVRA